MMKFIRYDGEMIPAESVPEQTPSDSNAFIDFINNTFVDPSWSNVDTYKGDHDGGLAADIAIWILEKMGDALIALGKLMLQIGPDISVMLAMTFCLGAICGFKKAGKWTINFSVAAIVIDIARRGILG